LRPIVGPDVFELCFCSELFILRNKSDAVTVDVSVPLARHNFAEVVHSCLVEAERVTYWLAEFFRTKIGNQVINDARFERAYLRTLPTERFGVASAKEVNRLKDSIFFCVRTHDSHSTFFKAGAV
jgi:hypothetical protein